MDAHITKHFADIIAFAQIVFENVDHSVDMTPERAILRLTAEYGAFRIVVTELFSENLRKYRYYALKGDWVEVGFDNSPDPQVIRLKYGRIGKEHVGEHIPHVHLQDKTELALTDDMTFQMFVEWLKTNIIQEEHGHELENA
ncbi:hypothetical protein U14_02188 [Candidatus Moduliflexus flocculans]|uniref:Uncharacterized protein n=1 Tax=Candidatus Moduliflexus flocculans TaxID=1499966 RepID=A0A0S6VU06_9BACT|nr:hypothetical protein U14_02188 [Candidatus Moduliflexus flocculans]